MSSNPQKKPSKPHKPRKPRISDFSGRKIVTYGLDRHLWSDLYHICLSARWPVFFGAIAGLFILLNLFFAALYSLGDNPIANPMPNQFLGAFFFSIETLATVGYGDMHPQTLYGHIVSTVELFLGMISIALLTGIIFARFSRPRALIMFANNPVVCVFNGAPTLMIRTANGRQNFIVDASAKLRMTRSEVSPEGHSLRRVYDLTLLRNEQPLFVFGWTLMHVIDEHSPLFDTDPNKLIANRSDLILTLQGVDESTTQTMQARHTYAHKDILWGYRYVDIFHTNDHDGSLHTDYGNFHATEPMPQTESVKV